MGNAPQQHKILILAAIPHGLRLDKEIRSIFECIQRAVRRNMFELDIRTAVRLQDIRRAIAEEKPQIVHFCGHGLEDGSLLLEDDGGHDKTVSSEGLASLFELHSDYVKCVLLNACHSAKSAEAISEYINYAIGMNQQIQDKSAIQFAQGFYDGLGYAISENQDRFQRAFQEGLVAMKLENLSEAEIPVIKTRINIDKPDKLIDIALLVKFLAPCLSFLSQSKLVWKSRSSWVLWLLILVALLGIGRIAFMIWLNLLYSEIPPPSPKREKFETKDERINKEFKPTTPLPRPKIIDLSSSRPVYEEIDPYLLSSDLFRVTKSPSGLVTAPIRLNWKISIPKYIKELRLIGKAPDGSVNSVEKRYKFIYGNLPIELRKFCIPPRKLDNTENLICNKVPIYDTGKAGEYIFTLTVISKTTAPEEEDQPLPYKQTPTIKVKPLPSPKIIDFLPVHPTYQEVDAVVQNNENSTQITTKKPPILLNWRIKNPNQIKELRLIGTHDGSLSEYKTYLMSRRGLPIGLKNCYNQENILDCRNILTKAIKPGKYIFKIVLIPKQEQADKKEEKTEVIKIQSQPTPELFPGLLKNP